MSTLILAAQISCILLATHLLNKNKKKAALVAAFFSVVFTILNVVVWLT